MPRHRLDRRQFLQSLALTTSLPLSYAPAANRVPAEPHLLDPLSAREIEATSRILQASNKTDRSSRFWSIGLAPTPKEGGKRLALAIVFQRDTGIAHEHIVDLANGRVVDSKPMPGSHVGPLNEEYERALALTLSSPEFLRAMAKRGIADMRRVFIEIWAQGAVPSPGAPEAGRMLRVLPYYTEGAATTYSRPVEGIIVTVDMSRKDAQGVPGVIAHMLDTGVVPLPPEGRPPRGQNPGAGAGAGAARVTVDGHRVSWGPWQFRTGLFDREGLVIYDVRVRDGERYRSILYRASIAEMIAFYGDPDKTWAWRNAFDEADYGLGKTSSKLRPGAEAPGGAIYMDGVIVDDLGKAKALPNRIALYERDAGILWTHTDILDNTTSTRRANELVVMSIATIGNYDYVIQWIFAEDGRLTFRVDLTGIMLAKGVRETRCAACDLPADPAGRVLTGLAGYGTQVAPRLVATYHQHFVNVRLDFDIDGTKNALREMELVPVPAGPENPLNNGFTVKQTALLSEKAARRDAASGRYWKVINPERVGPLGHYPAYAIHPLGPIAQPLRPENAAGSQAGFMEHTLWATKHRESELYASGAYVTTEHPQGLPQWTERDDPLEGEDLVVWYTVGTLHVPRAEEWPIMPVAHMGFTLEPHNFFDNNPAYG